MIVCHAVIVVVVVVIIVVVIIIVVIAVSATTSTTPSRYLAICADVCISTAPEVTATLYTTTVAGLSTPVLTSPAVYRSLLLMSVSPTHTNCRHRSHPPNLRRESWMIRRPKHHLKILELRLSFPHLL